MMKCFVQIFNIHVHCFLYCIQCECFVFTWLSPQLYEQCQLCQTLLSRLADGDGWFNLLINTIFWHWLIGGIEVNIRMFAILYVLLYDNLPLIVMWRSLSFKNWENNHLNENKFFVMESLTLLRLTKKKNHVWKIIQFECFVELFCMICKWLLPHDFCASHTFASQIQNWWPFHMKN